MKKKIIYLIALTLICCTYYCSLKNYRAIEKKSIAVKEFAIVTSEDIYTDTIDLRLYTSHGRLKYNKEENENR